MLRIKIEKTPEGFILREPGYTAITSAAGAVLTALACVVLFCLAGYLDTVRQQIGGYLMAALMAVMMVRTGYSAVIHWNRRMVLDGEGCRLQGTLLKERLIPWNTVRDLGVTYKAVRSNRTHQTSHIYTLYISPTRLSNGSDGREIRRENRAVTLSIRGDDLDELLSRQVFDFCEQKINQGREESDRVCTYVASRRYGDSER